MCRLHHGGHRRRAAGIGFKEINLTVRRIFTLKRRPVMSDIHKRDYRRELVKKKSRRTQKHRASQRQLTAKFKKELAGKKRQEQTAESRAAEQAEQSAELLTQEGATRLASGATTLLLHGKKNRIGNEQEFSDNNPSIHPSNQATTAPDETVPWNAKSLPTHGGSRQMRR